MSTIVCRGLSFGCNGSERNVFTNLDRVIDTDISRELAAERPRAPGAGESVGKFGGLTSRRVSRLPRRPRLRRGGGVRNPRVGRMVNHRRILEVIANRPPAEAEAAYYRQAEHTALAA